MGHMTRARRGLTLIGVLLVTLAVTGCIRTERRSPSAQTDAERANAAFQRIADDIEEKEGMDDAPTAHLLAGKAQLSDGTRVSLWVSDPVVFAGVRSRCFYVDTEDPSGAVSGSSGCGEPTDMVVLNRDGAVLVGSVGNWPSRSVRLEVGGASQVYTVTGGYFLVTPPFVGDEKSAFTLTLLDDAGLSIGAMTLTGSGAATPK